MRSSGPVFAKGVGKQGTLSASLEAVWPPPLVLILRTGEVFENGLGHVSGRWVATEAPVVVEWSKECATAALFAALIPLPDSWFGRPSVDVELTRSGARPGVADHPVCVS